MSFTCLVCRDEFCNEDPWTVKANDSEEFYICDDCMQALLDLKIAKRLKSLKE